MSFHTLIVPGEAIKIVYHFSKLSSASDAAATPIFEMFDEDGACVRAITNADTELIFDVVEHLSGADSPWAEGYEEGEEGSRVYTRLAADGGHETVWGVEYIDNDGKVVVLAVAFKYKTLAFDYVEKHLRPTIAISWVAEACHGRQCERAKFHSEVFGRWVTVFILPMPLFTSEAQLDEPLRFT